MSRPISSESAFRAAADPTRRRIIDLLYARDATPGDLNQTLRIRGGVLTFHLRVLAQAGAIAHRRRGRQRVYRLQPAALAAIAQWAKRFDSRRARPAAGET